MAELKLRQVGGSAVLTIPKPILLLMNAKVGDSLKYEFKDGTLSIHAPTARKRHLKKYDLATLLKEHKKILPELNEEYQVWENSKPVGEELI